MKILKISLSVLLTATFLSLNAQDNKVIRGRVVNENGQPVPGAFISVSGERSVQTNEVGEFELTTNTTGELRIWADGYYGYTQPLSKRTEISIVLISTKKLNYSDVLVMPFHNENINDKTSSAVNINKKDFTLGSMHVEDALKGKFAGLRVVGKSGMPSEGAYLNFRGIRSLIAENSPLIVINGVPYFPDMNESPLIGGYSRSIFNNYNINDFQNITLLKGADAAMYGSLGSNGVILIETDGASSDGLDTRITFTGQYGVNFKNKTLPLLGVSEYKKYLTDIGTTYYQNMADLIAYFPFLVDNPDDYYRYMYNSNTN
ncbi:MAG: TonB-dependent receptor plug domain-containing protein [Odoribacter sp.]|nr:TonB-dependent receptor plug domain-containing protein [Odoribacter sp.]